MDRRKRDRQALSGVGDSLLINHRRGVFAIADSPDSNPSASRNFLYSFNRVVEDLSSRRPEFWNGCCDVDLLTKSLTYDVNRLIESVDYRSSTTFSCMICLRTEDNVAAIMLHAGDTCIFKVNTIENTIEQISRSSINFVGKADKISQAEPVEVQHDTRFVLCSDGLQVLARNSEGRTLQAILLEAMRHPEVHEIPDLIMKRYVPQIELPDDLAVIVLDPHKLNRSGETILLGGEAFNPRTPPG
ncbi:MAG: hypothetical protein RDU20_10530 [Desulfomonilaceae bacterium]|nr:hypothetical protein [Desulfomonilaceae bacterium]